MAWFNWCVIRFITYKKNKTAAKFSCKHGLWRLPRINYGICRYCSLAMLLIIYNIPSSFFTSSALGMDGVAPGLETAMEEAFAAILSAPFRVSIFSILLITRRHSLSPSSLPAHLSVSLTGYFPYLYGDIRAYLVPLHLCW